MIPAEVLADERLAAKEELEYYIVDDEKYIDVEGETYLYLTADDFEPITNSEIVMLLENSGECNGSRASVQDYLPVPPTYKYDLRKGTYTGTVDISNSDKWSPLIRRDTQKRYMNIQIDTFFNQTISYMVCWYNAISQKWEATTVVDRTFNVIVDTDQIVFSTVGDGAQGVRIMFFCFDNTPDTVTYTLEDTNMAIYN